MNEIRDILMTTIGILKDPRGNGISLTSYMDLKSHIKVIMGRRIAERLENTVRIEDDRVFIPPEVYPQGNLAVYDYVIEYKDE